MDLGVQMARSDLTRLQSMLLQPHEMLKNVSEAEGFRGLAINPKLQSG